MASTSQPPSGPPYPNPHAGLGGLPTKGVDVPISTVFIVLFILGAIWHMTVLQVNNRRQHKFVLSGLCFGLCMARITANILRIVWACYPHDVDVAIAANVFSNAGVVLLFIMNLVFAQRILRAHLPAIGWSLPGKMLFRFLYASIGANLIVLITVVVYQSFTLDPHNLLMARKAMLAALVWYDIIVFLPIPLIALTLLLPGRAEPVDLFGTGQMRTKIALVLFTATFLTWGATMRTTAAFEVRSSTNPGWFDAKALYYCANYGVEIICVYTYGLMRMDKRFHIHDGSHKYGHYRNGVPEHERKASKKEAKKENAEKSMEEGSLSN